jgi:hypothetical protein
VFGVALGEEHPAASAIIPTPNMPLHLIKFRRRATVTSPLYSGTEVDPPDVCRLCTQVPTRCPIAV